MGANTDKTEQPTQKRSLKAREKGQFVTSRELITSAQFITFLWILSAWGGTWLRGVMEAMALQLAEAAEQTVTVSSVHNIFITMSARYLAPLLIAGFLLVLGTIAAQLISTGMGFSLNRLAPDMTKFNPVSRLSNVAKQGIPSTLSALLLLVLFGAMMYWLVVNRLRPVVLLSLTDVSSGLGAAREMVMDLLWKGASVLLLMGLVDYARQFRRHFQGLKMSKQEVRDEMKDSDGNPLIKMRLRRLQREMRRLRMFKDVETATAVVVNPTHYAVAMRYDHGSSPAPRVVAKGRGLIALRIKEIAARHQVPIIETPPLARALYKAVELRQEIPHEFYRAVAEVLAYVYRLTNPEPRRGR